MDLHRIEGKAEWLDVPRPKRNGWQRIAARTSGIATIGNFFSLIGLLSVPYGLWLIISREQYVLGVIILLAGRACDLLDGLLADKTGTKSPLGEKIDASFDKLSTALAVGVLAFSGLIAWWVMALLLVPHFIIAVLAVILYFRGEPTHPSRAGKLSMAAIWLSLLAFVFSYGIGNRVEAGLVTVLAFVLLTVSVAASLTALVGYAKEFKTGRG